jgi:hypothetical protein
MRKPAKKTERSPAAPADGLPFDWMDYRIPDPVLERNADHRLAMHQDDVRVRASLLKRLGWPRESALHRCLGNQEWAFETYGVSPLSKDETRTLVKATFDR